MAESPIVSALLKALLEKLASGTLQQLENMLGVPRELEKLQSWLITIQWVLQDAEEKEVKDAALRNWLEKLKNAAYDADDVLDEAHYELLWRSADIHHGFENKVNDFFSSSHNPLFYRAKMSRKVKDVVERLDAIAQERSNFHLSGAAAGERQPFEWRQTHSYVIESEVIERGEDKRRIIEMLLSHESSSSSGGSHPRVLPIVGMGGLGKTTLAQMVYNDEQMTARFELRMWVCVSDDFRIARLAKEIIESGQGGSVTGDPSLDQLQRKLRGTIGSKRYPLMLDDVWNEDPEKWEELRVLLTFGGQGSMIIVTTRSDIVAKIVDTIGPYQLAHLSEDGCWELFKNKAFPRGVGKRPKLVQIGKEISKKCKGLPLAAKVIGSMMHLKTEEREWMNVLNSEVWEMEDRKDGIIPVLKLSYHQLHPHLKQCFAFCAIFPKDYEIDKEYLIQLWMANGLIPTEGRLELEEKGDYIFKELASRSFFQDIKEVYYVPGETARTTCKIHDLIHDLAQSIMSKDCVILNDEMLKRTSDDATIRHLYILFTTSLILTAGIYNSCKTLRTLVRSQHTEVPYSIWSKLRSLRVLDLQLKGRLDAPISVKNWKHLRYLDLSYTCIETLPEAISQLFYLQTLKIECCPILHKLPKGIRNMCSLRHVYNSDCRELDSMPRGLDKLSHLQTLSLFVASERPGSGGIAELEDLNLGGVLHLRKLENVMSITYAAKARLGSKRKIKSLVLEWEFSREDDSEEITKAEEILEALQPHEEIQYLKIIGYCRQQCPSWLARCHLLKNLEINRCLLSNIPGLPSLTELTVADCPVLYPANRGFFRRMSCLEKLLIGCSDKLMLQLESEDEGDDEWSSPLRVLKISGIHTRMFSSESCLGMWKNLNSLETLYFHSCSGLVSSPGDTLTGGEGGLRLQGLTSLESLDIKSCRALHSVNLEGLHRLRDVRIESCSELKRLQGSTLTGLNNLKIKNCRALTALPDGMQGLTGLGIHYCPLLAGLPVGLQQRLPHLQTLVIHECPLLAGRCEEGGDYWHLVSSIPDTHIF